MEGDCSRTMEHLDHYTCVQALERLDDYIDRELSRDEVALVEAHLGTCADCAAKFRFEGAVVTAIRGKLAHLEVPVDLAERILAQLPACPTREE